MTLRSCKQAWKASLLMACAMDLASLWGAEDTVEKHMACLSGDVTLKKYGFDGVYYSEMNMLDPRNCLYCGHIVIPASKLRMRML